MHCSTKAFQFKHIYVSVVWLELGKLLTLIILVFVIVYNLIPTTTQSIKKTYDTNCLKIKANNFGSEVFSILWKKNQSLM